MKNNEDKNHKHEHGKHVLHLTINNKKFEWHKEYISGVEIRELGNIPHDEEIFLSIKDWPDEHIPNDKQINLARPGIEHFYSKTKEVTIVINGTPHHWKKEKITFKEIIVLAFGQFIDKPTMVYTVAYEDGPKQNPEGSMYAGQEVFVKNKMVFHATATDKS